jgi:hypothetical protein
MLPKKNHDLAYCATIFKRDECQSHKRGSYPGKQGGEQNIERKAKRYWLIGIGSIA